MENQFKVHGIPADDVVWITTPNKKDPLPSEICIHPTLTKGQIACTYKHYLALKDIVKNHHQLAVIMEDNIEFRGNVPTAIERYLQDLPPDWDMVFDSDFLGLTSTGQVFGSVQKTGTSKGANFILVNLEAATDLVNYFLPFNNCSDHHYNDLIRNLGLDAYWALPPNVHKLMRPSTWKDDKKFIWSIAK